MKLLIATGTFALLIAAPAFAQTTVPGTVRADPPAIGGAPSEIPHLDASATADNSASTRSAPTDNAPISESDLTTETAKNPMPPSLKPWAPTTTTNDAAKAPPQ